MENLETRILLHNPTIQYAIADNRGEVQITLDSNSSELDASFFNKNSVQMYEAGADGILGNADDFRVAASVRFTPSNQRLLIRGPVTAGNGYRIKIVSSRIPVSPGFALDGNFTGSFPSGDGVAGGNFEMRVKNDKSATPTARFSTSEGTIDVRLFFGASTGHVATPKNVINFLTYANATHYDNIFVHRVAKDFVVQFGGLNIQDNNTVGTVATGLPVNGEPGNLNVKYSLALALSTGPNSGTNEFFFNMDDNTSLDDDSNGGPFTVFGEVSTAGGRAVLDAMNARDRANLSSTLGGLGSSVDNVPVNPGVPISGQTDFTGGTLGKTLDPFADLILVRRVAVRSRVAAL